MLGMGAWWLSTPYLTARQFVTLMRDGKFEDANYLLVDCCWETDPAGYILLKSGNRNVSLTAKDWQDSFQDAQANLTARSSSDLLRGRHPILSKTRFGDFAFNAGVGGVSCIGLVQPGKAGWGLVAGTPNNGSPAVSGSYSCCDAQGGSVIIQLDGEQSAVLPAYFGTNAFTFGFDVSYRPGKSWMIRLVDSGGAPRKQLQGTLSVSQNP
jgi:hypothetical protein